MGNREIEFDADACMEREVKGLCQELDGDEKKIVMDVLDKCMSSVEFTTLYLCVSTVVSVRRLINQTKPKCWECMKSTGWNI